MVVRFKKPEAAEVQGVCVECKKRPQRHRGKGKYGTHCRNCHHRRFKGGARPSNRNKKRFAYRKSVKEKCERCGFVPEHECQLDVDHIDGNRDNNVPENLQTLCANCHRLKTFLAEDWKPAKNQAFQIPFKKITFDAD